MLQTLAAFPAITSPITVIQGKTISANVAQVQNLSNRQLLAFEVICLAYRLNTAGGTDYRTNHAQLRQDAESLLGVFQLNDNPLGDSLANRIAAVIEWNAAYTASTAIGTDVSAIVILAGRLSETPSSFLWIMILLLRYKLSILGA